MTDLKIFRGKKLSRMRHFEKFRGKKLSRMRHFETFRGKKLSRMRHFETFRGKKLSRKGPKNAKPRKFLPAKVSDLKVVKSWVWTPPIFNIQ